MKYQTLDLLAPMKLYINGVWVDVYPISVDGYHLLVKNIDKKHCPLIEYKLVDLNWHFTVAEGKQIKNVSGKMRFWDKVRFIVRSNV
jgi:hypothetical protein